MEKRKGIWMNRLGLVVFGLLLGLVVSGVGLVKAMPGLMIKTERSMLEFEATVAALEGAIPTQGWVSPGTLDMNQSLSKHGVTFKPRVKLIQMCQPQYAEAVLKDARQLACMMPCAVAVWEDDTGQCYVSKMNTGLMGRIFGGVVAEVMGERVSADEAAMLSNVL